MNAAIWANLFWKEWREHQWKLAALAAIPIGLHLWVLDATEPSTDHYAMPLMMIMAAVIPIGSAFVAMGVAAQERSAGTLAMLQAFPLDLRRLAGVKLLVGILSAWLPILLGLLLTCAVFWLGTRYEWSSISSSINILESTPFPLLETGSWIANFSSLTLATISSVVIWFAALGVTSSSEVRAGAIGLVVTITIWTVFALLLNWTGQVNLTEGQELLDLERSLGYAAAALPGGIWITSTTNWCGSSAPLLWIPYLSTHLPLAWWYVSRFGRVASATRESMELTPAFKQVGWLGAPRKSALRALLWKHWRQAGPVMITGFACAVGLATAMSLSIINGYDNSDPAFAWESFFYDAAMSTMFGFTAFGCLAGLITGVGLTTLDLSPSLYAFWRSRPISIDRWYWTLVASGLVMLSLAFILPMFCGLSLAPDWEAAMSEVSSARVLCPAIMLLSYTVGIFTGCVLRHTVYACLLGFALFLGIYAAAFGLVGTLLGSESLNEFDGIAIVAFMTCLASLFVTATAWWFVRRDWYLSI